jgi:hypothetical protein
VPASGRVQLLDGLDTSGVRGGAAEKLDYSMEGTLGGRRQKEELAADFRVCPSLLLRI